ncbi:MAG: EF-P lysine aminoacylase EpmA [Thermodesulfobacteriota bacterium]|nr:EF-P lysine aminoacylase EpmA [Thermodesulfobacteriota bacterium]
MQRYIIQMTSFPRNLQTRARIMRAIRQFFENRRYLEVDTPCRIPAPMPEATILAQPSGGWFLQTSPEICMKQLLARGLDRIYQLCKAFRQQERGPKHLPEFTILEWYQKGADYNDLMAETRDLIRFIARQLAGTPDDPSTAPLPYQRHMIDLSQEWEKLTVDEAFSRYASISLETILAEPDPADRFDECMGFEIEPKLGWDVPVFLYDYPASLGAAYARCKHEDPAIVERFELYIGGLELCNGFSELTGRAVYKKRFETEDRLRQARLNAKYPTPKRFLDAVAHMPDAAGNALGVDRLVMLFCNTGRIDDVVAFTPETL